MSQKSYDELINSPQGLINGTLRDVILPAILGKETDELLYWIGKDLARQYPVASRGELVTLTHQLGLGDLTLEKHSSTSQLWRLGGPIVAGRIKKDDEETTFGLECGFLAQEIEFQLGTVVEAKLNDRHHDAVDILLENDPQTDSNSERAELATFIHLQNASSSADQPQDVKPGRHLRKRRAKKQKSRND
ncbi:DUF2507 domain-containing protein [Limosilactobacillus antri]|uniref:DUF2507 domain-containing protein n=1 Tax=Limosilactobacillus antri TaxID=227943 RepID=UPI001F58E3AE|nr:DUF2507 domain-containing protein [Limosilactobacillus antri]